MTASPRSNFFVAAAALAVLLAAAIGAAASLLHPAAISSNIAALAEAEAVDDARDLEWLAQLDALGALDEEALAPFAAPPNEPLFNEMARLDELLIDDDGVVTENGDAARERARLHAARAAVVAARRAARASLLDAIRGRNARCGAQPQAPFDPCLDPYRRARQTYSASMDSIRARARDLYDEAQEKHRQANEHRKCANALWDARQICLAAAHRTPATAAELNDAITGCRQAGQQNVPCSDVFRRISVDVAERADAGRQTCREARLQAALVCGQSPIRFH
jgi:hypothetical protein